MRDDERENEVLFLKAEVKRLRRSLSELTPPLSVLLRRRGFRIYKKEPKDDLLVPEGRFIEDYYRYLNRYSFRLFLRDVIKNQDRFTVKDVTRYATQGVTSDYIGFLALIGLIEKVEGENAYSLRKRPVKSFGPTLEWFISEIFRREFAAEAVWGVKFKRPIVGGDYDLVAKIDGSILSMEVKSSPPKQIYANEISAFFDRVIDLRPEIAVFFMDTELRMKDKIVPMFEDELRRRSLRGMPAVPENRDTQDELVTVRRIEKELFHIRDKIFIINAKDGIVQNIERILIRYFRGSP